MSSPAAATPRPATVAINLVALSSLLVLGLIGFTSSYGGWWFMVPALAGVAAGLLVGTLSALRGWSAWTAALLALAAFLLLGGPVALPETTIAGVLPTLETIRGLVSGAVAGWKQLITTAPPVGSTPPLLVVPFVTGLVGATVGARLSIRVRPYALALVPPVAVLAISILVGTRFPVSLLLQGAVFGMVAAGWMAWRNRAAAGSGVGAAASGASRAMALRRLAMGTGMLLVAGMVALPLGPLLPGADARPRFTLREQAEPPIDPSDFAAPLGSMRKYSTTLREDSLFVVSGLPEGARIRLAAMDTYDGVVWGVAGSATGTAGASGSFERIGSTALEAPDGESGEATVRITGYNDHWLPDAGDIVSISFDGPRGQQLANDFRYNQATGTGLSITRLGEGDEYRFTYVLPATPDADAARELPLGSQTTSAAPAVEAVKKLQAEIAAAAEGEGPTGFYEQVDALVTALREDGYYSNGDTEAGRPASLPGHGSGRLRDFAGQSPLIGDEEQYAATAGLMANYLGVPVRVVMGAVQPADTPGEWEVLGSDISAWIEVQLGDSWIPFDVLPDKDKPLPEEQQVQQRPRLAPQQPLPPPPPDNSEAVIASDVEAPDAEEETAGGWRIPPLLVALAKYVGLPLLLVGGIIGGMAGAKAWRRRRRRSNGMPSSRISGGWQEITGVARDYGHTVPSRATRREVADSLAEQGAVALAVRADRATFGPDQPSEQEAVEYWDAVDGFRRDVRRSHPLRRRLRALLSLKSWRSP